MFQLWSNPISLLKIGGGPCVTDWFFDLFIKPILGFVLIILFFFGLWVISSLFYHAII